MKRGRGADGRTASSKFTPWRRLERDETPAMQFMVPLPSTQMLWAIYVQGGLQRVQWNGTLSEINAVLNRAPLSLRDLT